MDLPPEILQRVFVHLDGADLMKCQQVCTLWLREVKHCELKQRNFWKNRCVQEVGWDFLPSFIQKLFPNYFKDNATVISWKSVYICWFRWKLLSKWPEQSRDLLIKRTGRIVRAEFYGHWIVYATNDFGSLIACRMNSPYHSAKIIFQGVGLKDFLFLSSEDPQKPPLSIVVIITERSLNFYDLENDCLLGRHANSNNQNWCHQMLMDMYEQMNSLNPDSEDSELLELPEHIKDFNLHVEILHENGEVHCTQIETNTKWVPLHKYVALGISNTPKFRHVVAFIVRKKYKVYYPSGNFGQITAAMLHGNNLFVSTSNGVLHHYTIANLEDFLELDFVKFDWSIRIHEVSYVQDKIQSIDVCELYNRPYILLAISNCRVVIVDFMGDEEAKEYFPNFLTSIK